MVSERVVGFMSGRSVLVGVVPIKMGTFYLIHRTPVPEIRGQFTYLYEK